MTLRHTSPFLSVFVASATLVAAANPQTPYEARIRRTSFGIPHIEAKDLGSLGFGEGYAQAEDHLCTIADQIVRVRGERAKYFGPGPNDACLLSDTGMKALRITEDAARENNLLPRELRDWQSGFVAGYNHYLERGGRSKTAKWCRDQSWVFPITVNDIASYSRMLALTLHAYAPAIAAAAPPGESTATARLDGPSMPEFDEASNGWALGRDKAAAGHGMLVANPHYPWVGSNRFWEKHLTIPGKLDIYGVGLIGMQGVAIGFNRAIGWTHTVSAGKRVTMYELKLVPGRPTSYRYGQGTKEMSPRTVVVEVRQPDGSTRRVKRTVWFSHYGPIVNLPGIGWTAEHAIAVRDANEDNHGRAQMYLAMARARNLDEFKKAQAEWQATMWVNTIATSAEGRAWYADLAATPRLAQYAIDEWTRRRERDPLTKRLWQQGGNVLLDGSDPRFEWQDDQGARSKGIVAFDHMPQMERTDYVFNANDSFWLANSSAPLEGPYSPMHGEQRTPRSLRTRNNDLTLSNLAADKPAGGDGEFTLDEMADALLGNRGLTAELVKDELTRRCREKPVVDLDGEAVDLKEACDVLAKWDCRYDIDSRGAVLFREFIGKYSPEDTMRAGRLFATDFAANDPVNTPRDLAPGGLALENLARAVKLLRSRSIALDVTLGAMQYADKDGRRIAIHGGDGTYEGVMNMQHNARNTTTLEPMDNPKPVQGSRFLTEKGYPAVHGSSFILALEYTDAGPHAKAFLTYSESGDPESPMFSDQTERFSKKQWRPVLFTEAEIRPDVKREYRVSAPRR
jgi:acyl-homoserine-lactone acylase